ncbi:hypothetical protein Pmani_033575 [Petrolisthes manimaculis]|uniref:Uncharacterized protein n=1 Tax=Petrolisthes manimaculis TaxID=1843537 RepID=A0AAE1NQ76_9EUCA|nr:hypothetical protein Pmani_033575 [Petrolisthes manimaculis]
MQAGLAASEARFPSCGDRRHRLPVRYLPHSAVATALNWRPALSSLEAPPTLRRHWLTQFEPASDWPVQPPEKN